ncbi:hypothetical protein C6366_02260 [Desulfonatronum sp. SC1]|nr:hypothetical protein C6366_02260 [Desulfonatronum sp. SC1]
MIFIFILSSFFVRPLFQPDGHKHAACPQGIKQCATGETRANTFHSQNQEVAACFSSYAFKFFVIQESED